MPLVSTASTGSPEVRSGHAASSVLPRLEGTDVLFYLYLLLLIVEFVGVSDILPILKMVRFSTLLAWGLAFTVIAKVGMRVVTDSPQGKLLAFFVGFTAISVLYAIVTTHAVTALRAHIDYFGLFASTLYLVDRPDRIRKFCATGALIVIVLVVRNPDRLTSSERIGSFAAGHFLGDGNDFAWGMNVLLPFVIYLVCTRQGFLYRILGVAGVGAALFGIVGTQSRGASLALAASGLFYWAVVMKRKALGVAVLCVGAAAALAVAPPTYFQRLETIQSYEEDNSAMSRLTVWFAATRMATDYPLGVGASNFASAYGRHYIDGPSWMWFGENKWRSAHSVYFRLLGEYGFLGVIWLFMLLGTNWMNNWSSSRGLRGGPVWRPPGGGMAASAEHELNRVCGLRHFSRRDHVSTSVHPQCAHGQYRPAGGTGGHRGARRSARAGGGDARLDRRGGRRGAARGPRAPDHGRTETIVVSATPKPPATVFVTDGENRAALAIVRALGRRGHRVVVGGRSVPCLAQTSRWCAVRVQYPDPARDEGAFVARLDAVVSELGVDVLLPVTDITTVLLTQHRTRFEPRCRIPFADAPVIARAADKADILRTAMSLGIPVPRSVFLERGDQPVDLDGLQFPIVVKPHRSRSRTDGGWISSAVSFVATQENLSHEIRKRHPAEFPLILQETIHGPGMGIFVCYDGGCLKAIFCHRRLREKPPAGGVSVLSESAPVSPVARDYAERLMEAIGWQGVAMVEFKLDDRDNSPKLMEINGRFWGSLQLAVDAGVDFPNILVDAALGAPVQGVPDFRAGVRNRWFWGDVDSLLIQLFGRGTGRGRAADIGRFRALMQFLHLWGRDLHYENPRFGDFRPFLHETAAWLRGVR